MTQEEKAKAYDEALERAKEMCAMPTDKATMEYIFPELRESESEDEKIRKDLIYDIERLPMQGVLTHRPTSEYIAYLEKQEQKPAWSEEDTEMYINVASSLRGYACGLENEEHKRHIKKGLDWLENRFKSLRPNKQD